MTVVRLIFMGTIILAGAALVWQIAPAKSKLLVLRPDPHFPIVSGFNLNRQEFEFPRDFEGRFNLVVVPFQQVQQNTVNTWLPTLQAIEAAFPGFIYYELPTIYEMPVLSRTFINEGMRAGIPDKTARERTITLYLNKAGFKSALAISNEDNIHLFLVNQRGEILWRSEGAYSADKADELVNILQVNRETEKSN